MNTNQIYTKTLPFVWMKLGLGFITILLSILLLLLLTSLGMFSNSIPVLGFMILLWGGLTGVIHSLLNHYCGYLVKAGHVAVVTEAVRSGAMPENPIHMGFDTVKHRFATSSAYFVVDGLIAGAVKQIQHGVNTVDQLLGNIPGVSTLLSIANIFISMSLNYVDECCLGYTFYQQEQNVFKSATDGVVIYFQNWKRLLKSALSMTLLLVLMVAVTTIILFTLFSGIFSTLGWNPLIAIFLSFFLSLTIKHSFIDSYLMVKMVVSYLEVAPNTIITFDLYGKLCNLSSKFNDLFKKAKDIPTGASSVATM